jgi:hypothetical protein
VIKEEAAQLGIGRNELDWDAFLGSWRRTVRRIVLGDAAREDHELTQMLDRLLRLGISERCARRARRCGRAFTLASTPISRAPSREA